MVFLGEAGSAKTGDPHGQPFPWLPPRNNPIPCLTGRIAACDATNSS
jgi:hypothetical protein